MKFPVFDLHCDTADRLIGSDNTKPAGLRSNTNHVDLERAGKLAGFAQCFACFTTTSSKINPTDVFEKKLAALHWELEKNKDLIQQAYCAEDIERNLNNGIMSAILTIEGPAGFGFDPELLEDLYNVGFRISTLGWNESNPLTGSHLTGEGLTDLGREYVKEAQHLGMLVDVSHISDKGFWDIMDITNAPVIASHSNSRSICNVSRNITDDMFLEICRTGGVTGINLFSDFLGNDPNLNTVCDHILHFLELDPDGKHIALGGDLDGCDKLANGFCGVQDYPNIAEQILLRGIDEAVVCNIFWNNAMEVFKKCSM